LKLNYVLRGRVSSWWVKREKIKKEKRGRDWRRVRTREVGRDSVDSGYTNLRRSLTERTHRNREGERLKIEDNALLDD
jgi:hypothetical protein